MTSEERTKLESQIERHVRRGQLSEAWAALEQLSNAFPDDLALAQRLGEMEQGLDPAERRRVAMSRVEPTGKHQKTPMLEAEALAAAGKYKEAITIYRKLLEQRPDWDLVSDRIAELFQLAQVAAPNRPPVNREGLLQHLLDRISSRRRT